MRGLQGAARMSEREYELYRVIQDYEALQDGFLDRIEDLETTMASIPNFADGVVQKLLTKNHGKHVKETKRSSRKASLKRTFGWESLGKMLNGTGLALVLVVDDERFAPIKEQLAKRKRPPVRPNGSIKRPTWLFTRSKSIKMQVLRNQALSPAQRKRIAKRAAKARWRKVKSRPLIQQPAPQFDVASAPGPVGAQSPRATPPMDKLAGNPC